MTINKNKDDTINNNSHINWLPGMWVKRPIKNMMNFASSICEQSSAVTKSKSTLHSMTWHHSIMLHKYIIIEFSNRNCLRYTAIDDKDLECYRIVKSPKSYFHAQAIITRALSKYGQDIKYQVIKYNCEHFTNWCFNGKVKSKQIQRGCLTFGLCFGISTGCMIGGIIAFLAGLLSHAMLWPLITFCGFVVGGIFGTIGYFLFHKQRSLYTVTDTTDNMGAHAIDNESELSFTPQTVDSKRILIGHQPLDILYAVEEENELELGIDDRMFGDKIDEHTKVIFDVDDDEHRNRRKDNQTFNYRNISQSLSYYSDVEGDEENKNLILSYFFKFDSMPAENRNIQLLIDNILSTVRVFE